MNLVNNILIILHVLILPCYMCIYFLHFFFSLSIFMVHVLYMFLPPPPPLSLCFSPVADFGIAAQLTQTLLKRKSFIGTPYWLVNFPNIYQECCLYLVFPSLPPPLSFPPSLPLSPLPPSPSLLSLPLLI